MASVPPVWLYWTLHISAWLFGVVAPLALFFVAKGKDKPPRDDFAVGGGMGGGPPGGMVNGPPMNGPGGAPQNQMMNNNQGPPRGMNNNQGPPRGMNNGMNQMQNGPGPRR